MKKAIGRLNIITSNLYYPVLNYNKDYNNLNNIFIGENTNGCGSGWTAKLILNHSFSINFKVACTIHDLDYIFAKFRYWADRRLKANIEAIAKEYYRKIKKELNIKWWQFWKYDDLLDAKIQKDIVYNLAKLYYNVVRQAGKEAWVNGHKKKGK